MEYIGKNASIEIAGDALILYGRKRSLPRTIPFGAVREVLFKDAGTLGDGILWLVLGGSEAPPKVTAWAATGTADAITFTSKARNDFQHLKSLLDAAVAANRAAGIDSTRVGYDSLEDAMAHEDQRRHGKRLRDDIAAAAANIAERPKDVRRSIDAVYGVLGPAETVIAMTAGGYGSALANVGAVLVVTSERVIVVANGHAVAGATIDRGGVESVTWQQGVVGGRLDISGSGRAITLRAMDVRATPTVVDLLTPSPISSTDVLGQIERLHALLTSGALTQEEFESQKARLLD